MPSVPGLTAALVSAVCNGSFGSLSKIPSVQRSRVPSPVFNFWVACGIVVSSLPVLLYYRHVHFTAWGLLSGVLFVGSTANGFYAIQKLGLGVAIGIWSGVAVVASFVFGVRVNGDEISKASLAAPGLMLLVGGLVGIAFSEQAAEKLTATVGLDREDEEASLNYERDYDEDDRESATSWNRLSGLAAAVTTGLFGGLILAPMTFASEAKGVPFVVSMAAGPAGGSLMFVREYSITLHSVALAGPAVTAAILFLAGLGSNLHASVASGPGILSGAIWNAGNICSIVATNDPKMGLSIAYPIMQCGLLVAGLWGIFAFHELQGRAITVWAVSGLVLVIGASMLTLSK